MLAAALAACDRVTVFGFGDGENKGAYQYYKFHNTERKSGDLFHNFQVSFNATLTKAEHKFSQAELGLVRSLDRDGYLHMCTSVNDARCTDKWPRVTLEPPVELPSMAVRAMQLLGCRGSGKL